MPETVADPTRYLDPHTLASVGGLELRARMVVEGLMIGLHRSPYRGVSVEFAEHRQYAAGDDLRRLDWKVFGRSDKLYLKQYLEETNLRLIVLVDASGSMGYKSNGAPWRKFDHAATLAGALTHLALKQQDRVSVAVFGQGLIAETALSNARDHWRPIVNLLSSVKTLEPEAPGDAEGDAEAVRRRATDLARLFDQVTAKLTHRSLIVVVSDLFDDAEALDRGLARLFHRRHDTILFQTLDPAELTFPFRSPAEFIGMESEGRLKLDPAALRKLYLETFEAHQTRVEETARKFRFDYLRLDTAESLGPPLSQFLARRAAVIGKGRSV